MTWTLMIVVFSSGGIFGSDSRTIKEIRGFPTEEACKVQLEKLPAHLRYDAFCVQVPQP